MAWTTQDLTTITYSAVSYHFAPTELVYTGVIDEIPRQRVQTSDSGIIKIQQISDDEDKLFVFGIREMSNSGYTNGSTTILGYSALQTLLKDTLNYAENTCTLSPAGDNTGYTVRFIDGSFTGGRWIRKGSTDYYGDGSQIITFRQEIT